MIEWMVYDNYHLLQLDILFGKQSQLPLPTDGYFLLFLYTMLNHLWQLQQYFLQLGNLHCVLQLPLATIE